MISKDWKGRVDVEAEEEEAEGEAEEEEEEEAEEEAEEEEEEEEEEKVLCPVSNRHKRTFILLFCPERIGIHMTKDGCSVIDSPKRVDRNIHNIASSINGIITSQVV